MKRRITKETRKDPVSSSGNSILKNTFIPSYASWLIDPVGYRAVDKLKKLFGPLAAPEPENEIRIAQSMMLPAPKASNQAKKKNLHQENGKLVKT